LSAAKTDNLPIAVNPGVNLVVVDNARLIKQQARTATAGAEGTTGSASGENYTATAGAIGEVNITKTGVLSGGAQFADVVYRAPEVEYEVDGIPIVKPVKVTGRAVYLNPQKSAARLHYVEEGRFYDFKADAVSPKLAK
ncbi:MAG: hypothetical protein COZ98_05265, partial [Candidatus Omnitrophica bacterium CG_4_8_14_3_um_filter_43_15]